jgi:hypothetical protein
VSVASHSEFTREQAALYDASQEVRAGPVMFRASATFWSKIAAKKRVRARVFEQYPNIVANSIFD